MSTPSRSVWEQFTHDPRLADHAPMRASDKDRDVVLTVLSEAFAEGRLDRGELDERTTRVQQTKLLGDLVAPMSDLVGTDPPARAAVPASEPVEPRHPDPGRLLTFLVPTLVCWAVWVFTCFGPNGFEPYFPWPVFVTLGTARMAFGHLGHHPWHEHHRRRDPARELRTELGTERRLSRRGY